MAFKRYRDAMIFYIFIFIISLELTLRQELYENDFPHYDGNLFESTILKVLEEKDFTDIDRHRCYFFLE